MLDRLKLNSKVEIATPNRLDDGLKIKGHVTVKLLSKDGRVRTYEYENLITNAGKQLIRDLLCSTPSAPTSQNINYIAVGTGTTPPSATDTRLASELGRKNIMSRYPQYAKFAVQFEMYEQNPPSGKSITEAGLFANGTDAPDSGLLVARVLFSPAVLKQPDEMLVVVWTINLE